jgi:hypothetical protein
MNKPLSRIPSAETLLPLPEAAARLVYLVRNRLPGNSANASAVFLTAVEAAHRVAYLIGRAWAEMGTSPTQYLMSGWANAVLVKADLDGLATALQALLGQLGWNQLWGADRLLIISQGVTTADGRPVEPAEGVALIVKPKSLRPVPTKLVDALEDAAELLQQELNPGAMVPRKRLPLQAAETLTDNKQKRSPPIPKGKPGRRGYPLEALEYALNLREKNPEMKAAALYNKCLKKFSEDDLPINHEAFRRWLTRPRKKRANRAN